MVEWLKLSVRCVRDRDPRLRRSRTRCPDEVILFLDYSDEASDLPEGEWTEAEWEAMHFKTACEWKRTRLFTMEECHLLRLPRVVWERAVEEYLASIGRPLAKQEAEDE